MGDPLRVTSSTLAKTPTDITSLDIVIEVPSILTPPRTVVLATGRSPLPISEKLLPSLVYCHLSVVSFQRSDTLEDEPLSISIPPFCDGVPVSSLFRTSILSPIFTVLLLIVVVVPLTVKLLQVRFPTVIAFEVVFPLPVTVLRVSLSAVNIFGLFLI